MVNKTPVKVSQKIYAVLIIGAGIAGLAAHAIFRQQGIDISILEKSRGLGGRAATRRGENFRADHGAQFFRMKSDAWKLSRDGQRNALQEIYLSSDSRHPRYTHPEGMSAVARFFDEHPAVITLEKVIKIISKMNSDGASVYELTCESGRNFFARHVLLTAPIPQSLDLLERSHFQFPDQEIYSDLRKVTYDSCLSVIFELKSALSLGNDGIWKNPSPALSGIYNQAEKGLVTASPTLVVHLGSALSRKHWDSGAETVTAMIHEELQACLKNRGISVRVRASHFHRWKYSEPVECYPKDFAFLGTPRHQCILAGDGFKHSSIEGALLSGIAASNALCATGGLT